MIEAGHIIDILRARGNVILDGSKREPGQLAEMARTAASSRVTLVLCNMGEFSVDRLLEITRAGKGRVVLELDSGAPKKSTGYVGPFLSSR